MKCVLRYQCEHCRKVFVHEETAKIHEEMCKKYFKVAQFNIEKLCDTEEIPTQIDIVKEDGRKIGMAYKLVNIVD